MTSTLRTRQHNKLVKTLFIKGLNNRFINVYFYNIILLKPFNLDNIEATNTIMKI